MLDPGSYPGAQSTTCEDLNIGIYSEELWDAQHRASRSRSITIGLLPELVLGTLLNKQGTVVYSWSSMYGSTST